MNIDFEDEKLIKFMFRLVYPLGIFLGFFEVISSIIGQGLTLETLVIKITNAGMKSDFYALSFNAVMIFIFYICCIKTSKWGFFTAICVIYMGTVYFPSVMLTSTEPEEVLTYQYILPLIYILFWKKFSKGLLKFLPFINIFILTIINIYQFLKMGETPIHSLTMCLVYGFVSEMTAFLVLGLIRSLKKSLDESNKLKDKYKKLSRQDFLTGLYNRLALEEELKEYEEQSCYCIMVDVDNFKSINDENGHQVGDIVLQEIAKVLLHYVNKDFFVSRHGGEEFLLVSFKGFNNTYAICEKIRKDVERISRPHSRHPELEDYMSVSIGISKLGHFDNDTIVSADSHLYYAKSSGKNCIKWFIMDDEIIQEVKKIGDN